MCAANAVHGSIGGQDSARDKANEAVYFINFLLALILYAACISKCVHGMQFAFSTKLHICYQIRELIGEICVHGGGISISHLIVRAFFYVFFFVFASFLTLHSFNRLNSMC